MGRKTGDKQFQVATKDDYKIFDRRIRKMTSGLCRYTHEPVRCNNDCKNCVIIDPTLRRQVT